MKKVLFLFLTFVMMLSFFIGMTITASADEVSEESEIYIYVNSVSGNTVYVGTEPLGETIDEEILEKLNLFANGEYNKFVEFEEISYVDGVHTFYSVHNTEAELTVTGGTATKGDGYYILTASEIGENGKPFYGWLDMNAGFYISYDANYKFFPDESYENVRAMYSDSEDKYVGVYITATRTEDKFTVTVTPNYTNDLTNVQYGYYIAVSNGDMSTKDVIALAKGDSTVAPHAYMVRVYDIREETKTKNIYIVGWLSYDGGEPIYNNVITIRPNGTMA